MGMFDNVTIHRSLLPVSIKEKRMFNDETDWQTKSFERTDEDYFVIRDFKIDRKGNLTKDGKPFIYSGKCIFYTNVRSKWYEFEAKFIDGYLTVIQQIH